MLREVDPDQLEWARAVIEYAKNLDPKYFKVNAHLPPLAEDYGFHVLLPPSLLVRESYPAIYEYVKRQCLKEERFSRGLVITGHPGVGKTAFLFYALIRALHDGIPVKWCQSVREDWLQIEGDDIKPYGASWKSNRRLALYDQESPKSDGDGSYTVQAVTPKFTQYREWSKQLSAKFWVMQNWTWEEVDIEAKERGIDSTAPFSDEYKNKWYGKYSPQRAFEIVGPDVRRLFYRPTTDTGNPIEDFGLVRAVKHLFSDPETLSFVLRLVCGAPTSMQSFYPHDFEEIFYVRDIPNDVQPLDREELVYNIGTQWQRNEIRLRALKNNLTLDNMNATILFTDRVIGGYLFESYLQQYLIQRKHRLLLTSPLALIDPPDFTVGFDSDSPPKLDLNTLYSPNISNFPSLNFFFISNELRVVMVQSAICRKYSKSERGIVRVIDYIKSLPILASALDNLYYIFAVLDNAAGVKLVKEKSVSGEMTVMGYKIKVGYVVVEIEDPRVLDILRRVSEEEEETEMTTESDEESVVTPKGDL